MLWWLTCGVNEKHIEPTSIANKIRENRLRWLGTSCIKERRNRNSKSDKIMEMENMRGGRKAEKEVIWYDVKEGYEGSWYAGHRVKC